MNHLGTRVSALVDGQLGHAERERALAHVAHCATCREALERERWVKSRLEAASVPAPSDRLMAALQGLAEPGDPVAPRPRAMPLGPVVPTLPAPGRGPFGRRRDSRRPAAGGPARRARRVRYAAVGALSAAGLVLGTAFAAGGTAGAGTGTPVVPPAAELSVEHAATTSGFQLGDPAFTAVTASFGGLSVPAPARR